MLCNNKIKLIWHSVWNELHDMRSRCGFGEHNKRRKYLLHCVTLMEKYDWSSEFSLILITYL